MQPKAQGTQKRCIRFLKIGILLDEIRHLIPDSLRTAHDKLDVARKLAADGVAEAEGRS